MQLIIHTDGGSLKNPGQAAYAFTVHSDGKLIHKQHERIGIASNNVAEYTALVKALEYVKNWILRSAQDDIKNITVIADSEFMIRQVTGVYKVKHPDIRPLHSQVKLLEMEIGQAIAYKHVLRDKNAEADALVKQALGK